MTSNYFRLLFNPSGSQLRTGAAWQLTVAESSPPKISFSGDLGQSDITPVEHRRDTTLLDSNSDFEFNICRNVEQESSPADEIFANGMILPFQVQDKVVTPKRVYKYELPPLVSVPSPPPPPVFRHPTNLTENSRKESEKEIAAANSDSEAEKSSKSFWSFKRSSSLNCDIKKSLICSFPRLTRSNSTGSVTNSKRAMLKDVQKHSSQKHASSDPGANLSSSSFTSSSSLCCSVYQFRPQRPSGKKNNHGGGSYNGNGSVRISPVLSVPSPFGLGSILRNSRDKKKKK